MNSLESALANVATVLEREEIPYMVIGGFANLIWGETRATTDLDLTIDVGKVGLQAFAGVAAEIGEPLAEDPVGFAERTRVFPVRAHVGVRVDFVLATLPFEIDAIRRSRKVPVGEVTVAFCTPEDLIVHKAISERARDHDDIVGILKRQGARLNVAKLDEIIDGLTADLAQPEIAQRFHSAKKAAGRS